LSLEAVEAWGKLRRDWPDRATAPRLSLVAHSIDVAAVARSLLELPTWRKRLERLAGHALGGADLDRLTVLAFWHDVGKAGAGFQAKGYGPEVEKAWRWHVDDLQTSHTRVLHPFIRRVDRRFDPHWRALGIVAIDEWSADPADDSFLQLWLAALSHHGQPITEENTPRGSDFTTWLKGVAGYEPLHGLKCLGKAARRLWPGAFSQERSERFGHAFVHAFAGLVSLADWIASKAEDPFFPFQLGSQDEARWPIAYERARNVLRALRIDVETIRADLRAREVRFEQVFDFSPTPEQRETADPQRPSPLILEAETGSGKTEAALWRFKALFECGEVDSLCFLLPTRVAATGIYARIETFVKRCFPDPAMQPNTVLAVPGYLRANGNEGERLAPFDVLWPDDKDRPGMYWAAENSKRYFGAAATAGTVDQFLLSALQTGHSHLRAVQALRSLVVVDEVHASDRYMRTLLMAGLKRHVFAGGHALLLSATLASDAREELLRVALRGRELTAHARACASEPSRDDYPRLSSPARVPWIGQAAGHKRIGITLQRWMREPDAVAVCAATALEAGARVLIVRNTVRQAVATQKALEALLGAQYPGLFRCKSVAAPHHGRFALPDRQALDAQVERRFGKVAAKDRRACVLCATQTLEISVDCDADFLITDLAPMDVLLQRLGRLHRHKDRHGFRPAAHREAQCVVLVPPDRDLAPLISGKAARRGLGLGPSSAYPDLLCVEATWRALEKRGVPAELVIPRDNRNVVEQTCNASPLKELADSLGGKWPGHWNELQGKGAAQGSHASMSAVDWFKPWSEAAPGDLDTDVRTRLGLDGIDVELPTPWAASPFGLRIERLTVPAWMLPGVEMTPASLQAEIPSMAPGQLRFSLGARDLVYDRFGLALEG